MSSFNIKSTVLANRDADPSVLTDGFNGIGPLRESIGVERIPTTADVGSQVRLCTVPSSARLSRLDYCAAQLGTSALDIAVWYPTNVPQGAGLAASLSATLISSSAFAANIAGVDTGIAWTDGTGTIAQQSVQRRTQMLWQSLGLSSDPLIDLDIGFTVRTTNSIAGYVGLRAAYVE